MADWGQCAICLGKIDDAALPVNANCRHTFCKACLISWAQISMKCPLCKLPFEEIAHNIVENPDVTPRFKFDVMSADASQEKKRFDVSLRRKAVFEEKKRSDSCLSAPSPIPKGFLSDSCLSGRVREFLSRDLMVLLKTKSVQVMLQHFTALINLLGSRSKAVHSGFADLFGTRTAKLLLAELEHYAFSTLSMSEFDSLELVPFEGSPVPSEEDEEVEIVSCRKLSLPILVDLTGPSSEDDEPASDEDAAVPRPPVPQPVEPSHPFIYGEQRRRPLTISLVPPAKKRRLAPPAGFEYFEEQIEGPVVPAPVKETAAPPPPVPAETAPAAPKEETLEELRARIAEAKLKLKRIEEFPI